MTNHKILMTTGVLVVLLGGVFLVLDNAPAEEEQPKVNQTQQNMSDKYWQSPDYALPAEYQNKRARVQTNYGEFVISFYDEASLAVENFIRLGQEGKYAAAPFHRVIKGFMVQTGDYTNGNGTGGASIWNEPFVDQLNTKVMSEVGYKRGVVAQANSGANTNGSQFFVMHQDYPLPPNYVIFGEVTEGMETIDKIADIPVLETPWGEPSIPTKEIVIENVTIENR